MTQLESASTYMLLLGMAALGFGIRWARGIVTLQPDRKSWRVMIAMMVLSLMGYGVVAVGFSRGLDFDLKGMIAATMLAGAVFVSIVTRVSLSTVDKLTRVHVESITDALTGAFNRRFAEQRLLEEVSRAHRYRRPLSLLLFDLDRFKQINDSFGHVYGDVVLRTVAELLKDKVRNCDYFCRFGGEEFLVLLTETPLEGARVVAERMREAIDEHAFPLAPTLPDATSLYPLLEPDRIHITISIGVSTLQSEPRESSTQVLERADRGLYQCKKLGRNRVAVAALVESNPPESALSLV